MPWGGSATRRAGLLTFSEPFRCGNGSGRLGRGMARPDTALMQKLRQASAKAPIVVGHRGDSGNFPENTLASFAAAVRLGAGMVEFDVQALRDGTLVCIHDDTLDRTTDAAVRLCAGVRVDEIGPEQLALLDAGSWHAPAHRGLRVPTLVEALPVIAGGAVPMVEHKSGAPERYLEVLAQAGLLEQAIVQSFDWEFVARVRTLEPRVNTGLLGPGAGAESFTGEVLRRVVDSGSCLVHWDAKELHVEDVGELHRRGLLACTYTTDDDMGLVGGGAIGLDAITTNRPGRMLALVQRGLCRRPERAG
jgi:glycerophosphoryl diester phosphodiesterase